MEEDAGKMHVTVCLILSDRKPNYQTNLYMWRSELRLCPQRNCQFHTWHVCPCVCTVWEAVYNVISSNDAWLVRQTLLSDMFTTATRSVRLHRQTSQ